MRHFQHQKLEATELVLSADEHCYLGPHLVLERCVIVLATRAKALTISNCEIVSSEINAKKQLVNVQGWCSARISDCMFTGTFVGNDFGNWEEHFRCGGIENTDFSKAMLKGCRFMKFAIETITLPPWPCFTIFRPHQNNEAIRSLNWPGNLEFWIDGLLWSPTVTEAIVEFAPAVARQFDVTEEVLRQSLLRLDETIVQL